MKNSSRKGEGYRRGSVYETRAESIEKGSDKKTKHFDALAARRSRSNEREEESRGGRAGLMSRAYGKRKIAKRKALDQEMG